MYKFVKYIIIEILPNLTLYELINNWGFIH